MLAGSAALQLSKALMPSHIQSLAVSASAPILKQTLPQLPILLLAASSSPSPTALSEKLSPGESDPNQESNKRKEGTMVSVTPRAKSCLLMAVAMAFHFGGYEFARSGALALFTSSDIGFTHPSAYPFTIGLVTPLSLVLLYWYGLLLKARGPRFALWSTKLMSVVTLLVCTGLLKAAGGGSPLLTKTLVGVLFVFQNSYAHLLYTQQWSFLGSVMTPSEGTKWFSAIAGISSLVCTCTATLVHKLSSVVGLLGLVVSTAITLSLSMLLADRAYQLGEDYGFDPSEAMQRKKEDKKSGVEKSEQKEGSLLSKTAYLFQRVPTLAALFSEVICFQSLSTVLNVCFVRQLKENVPLDTERASYTGKFYAYINGSAGLMQFFVLPLARKYVEPKWAFRMMPVLLLPLLVYSAFQASSLWIAAAAFFSLKTLDYSLRNVVSEMVFQPLDFESRYLGKEVIGVFANRFGKSGMSLILSFVTPLGVGVKELSQLAVAVASSWSAASYWLSMNVLSNQEAEKLVQARQGKKKD